MFSDVSPQPSTAPPGWELAKEELHYLDLNSS